MVTLRVVRRHRFTIVDRKTVRDTRLSLRALGLLVVLLDQPDEASIDSATISAERSEGRDAVRTAMRELETAGYILRRKEQVERGRWVTVTYVGERPFAAAQDGIPGLSPTPENPAPVNPPPAPRNPAPGQPTPGRPGPKRERPTEAEASEEESSAATAAWGIVNRVYDARNPKPVMGKRQCQHLVERLLVAGHPADRVETALTQVRTISASSMETFLAGGAPVRALRPVDTDRAAPEGRVTL